MLSACSTTQVAENVGCWPAADLMTEEKVEAIPEKEYSLPEFMQIFAAERGEHRKVVDRKNDLVGFIKKECQK